MAFGQSPLEDLGSMTDLEFWSGRKVTLTGHTGFKGSWLASWLQRLGAHVTGYALPPQTMPSLFTALELKETVETQYGDIRDVEKLRKWLAFWRPEIVIHLAAQALVAVGYSSPLETYSTNVMGTANLLEVIRGVDSVRSVVIVTSDKCYEDPDSGRPLTESDALGGHDPYASSKACCEILTSSYRRSFYSSATDPGTRPGIATARAGNTLGGGDWAPYRLMPDLVRAFQSGGAAKIRSPQGIRPWQHVLEPLWGYLMLGQHLFEEPPVFSEAWNFGPPKESLQTVAHIADLAARYWGSEARWYTDADSLLSEAPTLRLDSTKARTRMGWSSQWSVAEAVRRSVECYKAHQSAPDSRHVLAAVERDISDYELSLRRAGPLL